MSTDWYGLPWVLFLLLWLVCAIATKRTLRREARAVRLIHGGLLALACLMLLKPWHWAHLDAPFLPKSAGLLLCGYILTSFGLAFAIWARLTLGRNWSSTVTIKEDHELVRRGPYKFVRHPIYTGLLLAMVGTSIGFGRIGCLLGLPVAFLAFWIKARVEERFMMAQFGASYVQYQREVKAFIPGLL